jgi:hypothetical protein
MDEGLELLEPTDLYNILQQSTCFSNSQNDHGNVRVGIFESKKIG